MASEKDQQINFESCTKTIASVDDSFDKLMGVEECGNEDEECFKRRAVLEAHLDYIYTQNRIP
ncbi:hypothetical protein C2S53_007358 [Perilla frutescens var. hirtella]|uniref:Phytosulfokine n=1 Tax=Perilla frutescens var. hirtella TaxID=608512 RepID=A0AAD4JMQ5_PERFH|nr:hypothetical protein C2S53_007358 [Perilla frutescens var. hirtella]